MACCHRLLHPNSTKSHAHRLCKRCRGDICRAYRYGNRPVAQRINLHLQIRYVPLTDEGFYSLGIVGYSCCTHAASSSSMIGVNAWNSSSAHISVMAGKERGSSVQLFKPRRSLGPPTLAPGPIEERFHPPKGGRRPNEPVIPRLIYRIPA